MHMATFCCAIENLRGEIEVISLYVKPLTYILMVNLVNNAW